MDLHTHPPMTLARVGARHRWLLPTALIVFLLLATGAVFNLLVWDKPLTAWVVDARTPWLDAIVRRVSFLGSTKVVLVVAGLAALASVRRCPRLALAIVVIALARPLAEFALKELISRDRPSGDRMVNGRGYSFPSGHPLATAASWCLLPLVVSLYTKRRILWWIVAISVWTLAVLVAMSRVWLGVHWGSDVVAALALAVLGVAAAERFISATHGRRCLEGRSGGSDGADAEHVDHEVVDRPVLEAAS
jgi:undecaprenyl-diphosphatase